MDLPNTFLIVENGLPYKSPEASRNFHIAIGIKSQTGYIEKRDDGTWKLYISSAFAAKAKQELFVETGKYYFYGETFEECKEKAEFILEKIAIVISRETAKRIIDSI